VKPLDFDQRGIASLDGLWEFSPGEVPDFAPEGRPAASAIQVPGLWEAQGHLELDGVAWYRLRFSLRDHTGWWSLRFGAVMDISEVSLNGVALGGHDNPFTPFVLDPTRALGQDNDLVVRVVDPPVSDPEHLRLAHGKQGGRTTCSPAGPAST
jgi:beta-galactosidase/beta-glucuronidase